MRCWFPPYAWSKAPRRACALRCWVDYNATVPDDIREILNDRIRAARAARLCPDLVIPVRLRLWSRKSEWLKHKPPGKPTSPIISKKQSKYYIWPACAPGQGDAAICFGGALVTMWHPALGDLLQFGPFLSQRERFVTLCGTNPTRYTAPRQREWHDIVEERLDSDVADPEMHFDQPNAGDDDDSSESKGASYFGREWKHDGRAEDWTQETLKRGLEKIDTFTPGTSIYAWLWEFRRKVRSEDSSKKNKHRRREVPDTYEIHDSDSDSEAEEISHAENMAACQPEQYRHMEHVDFRAALANLPKKQREALNLLYFYDSYKEAAVRFGCSEAAFERLVNRGRARLASVAPDKAVDSFGLTSNTLRSPYDPLYEVNRTPGQSSLKQGDALEAKRFPKLPTIAIARFPNFERGSQDRRQKERRVTQCLMREFEAEVSPVKICPSENCTPPYLLGRAQRRPFDLGPFFRADLYPGFDLPVPFDTKTQARWRTGLIGIWDPQLEIPEPTVPPIALLREVEGKQKKWMMDKEQEQYEDDKRAHPDFWAEAERVWPRRPEPAKPLCEPGKTVLSLLIRRLEQAKPEHNTLDYNTRAAPPRPGETREQQTARLWLELAALEAEREVIRRAA
jgi:RNA polymerase sigma-70 factor (ECF subfamily)